MCWAWENNPLGQEGEHIVVADCILEQSARRVDNRGWGLVGELLCRVARRRVDKMAREH